MSQLNLFGEVDQKDHDDLKGLLDDALGEIDRLNVEFEDVATEYLIQIEQLKRKADWYDEKYKDEYERGNHG